MSSSQQSQLQSQSQTKTQVIGNYTIGPEIGRGSFANVYKGYHNTSKKAVAVKSVFRSRLKNQKLIENLEIEISILKNLKNPHIVALLDCFQTDQHFHLIMEYCSLGDLSNFIRKRDQLVSSHPIIGPILVKYPSPPQSHGLNKVIVVNFVKQLASALQFLRSQNLVHRDIKPQNLLLSPPCQTQQEFKQLGYSGLWELPILKIADFGFARFLPSTSLAETLCGSPLYMAPEILRYEKYNAKADLWSVGAVIYEMSVGKPPFRAANHVELLRKIEKAKDEISFPTSAQVPEDITRLICGLLKAKPTERMGFQEFFNDLIVAERNTSSVLLESTGADLSAGSESSPDEKETHSSETEIESNTLKKITEAVEAPIDEIDSSPRSLQQSINNAVVKVGSSSPNSKPGSGNATKMKRNDSSTSSSVKDSNVVYEKEYVVVEKRTVEVNALADELAKAGTGVVAISPSSAGPLYGYSRRYSSGGTASSRSSSNASNHRRPSFTDRKMPISISPTNALTKALGYTSNRLFGALQQQQQQAQQAQQQQLTIQQHSPTSRAGIQLSNVQSTSPNPHSHNALITNNYAQASTFNAENALTNLNISSATAAKALKPLPQETILEDGEVIEHLKLLATMAHAVSLFAEVKFSQLIPSPPSSTTPATQTTTTNNNAGLVYSADVGLGLDDDESLPLTLPPDQVKTIAEEGVALYVKTLSLLAKAMSIASEWWHHNAFKSGTSPQLNELVQWIRARFNESLEKAEFLRLKLGDALLKLEQQGQQVGTCTPVVAEKLIFDRALEESRNAAVNELKNEDLLGCELSYSTSIWMLEALLNEDGPSVGVGGVDSGDGGSRKLDEDDRKTVQLFITSIGNRLKILRIKIEKQGIRN
ncbi:unnamed protein product [Ambrosiozyma monospora]|uniref:Unnamed protein product n=1 Tax=Ambrosiozyma monospora TaxID=43982 RepID=A0ACB5SWF7_AMBMO|nr:unnamed protein product [Ambrosiozyma monospora]